MWRASGSETRLPAIRSPRWRQPCQQRRGLACRTVSPRYSVGRTRARKPLSRALMRFCSRRRRTDAPVRRVAIRGFGTEASRRSREIRRSSAKARLRACERVSDTVTAIPVGSWIMRTADSVLCRCCPPGPLALNVSIRTWRRTTFGSSEKDGRSASLGGRPPADFRLDGDPASCMADVGLCLATIAASGGLAPCFETRNTVSQAVGHCGLGRPTHGSALYAVRCGSRWYC